MMGGEASHPYSRLLFSSVPKLDTNWLDNLKQEPVLFKEFNGD
jgi:peptide/nickel transport system ATP-binding protein